MNYEANKHEVMTEAGVKVSHTLITQDKPTDRLLVILPGRGYTCDHPVLHYLARVGADLGYDVLAITYGFHVEPRAFGAMSLPAEIDQAMALVNISKYQRVVFAGKSMGTPLAAARAADCPAPDRRLLLLTPIGDVVDDTGGLPTLAVIGTSDRYFSTAMIVIPRPNVTWQVYERLNHGLEDGTSWERSIKVLGEIMSACARFLK